MGREASHLVLESSLQTNPNVVLIGEEFEAKGWTLDNLVTYLSDIVAERSAKK